MPQQTLRLRFEQAVLAHEDAAYNLARWLTGNDQDAEDVVQEAVLRAFQAFGGFHGVSGRAWLFAIVRNTGYTWLRRNRPHELVPLDDEAHSGPCDALNPETILMLQADSRLIRQALEELPIEFREVMVLREMEGLSYKEIAEIVAIPPGTVMSRLARGRRRLQQSLAQPLGREPVGEEPSHEL